jgi:hypothetical protein
VYLVSGTLGFYNSFRIILLIDVKESFDGDDKLITLVHLTFLIV